MKNAIGLAFVLNTVLAAQAWSADVAAGERVAQAYCARCHDISANPKAERPRNVSKTPKSSGAM